MASELTPLTNPEPIVESAWSRLANPTGMLRVAWCDLRLVIAAQVGEDPSVVDTLTATRPDRVLGSQEDLLAAADACHWHHTWRVALHRSLPAGVVARRD